MTELRLSDAEKCLRAALAWLNELNNLVLELQRAMFVYCIGALREAGRVVIELFLEYFPF